LAGWDLAVSDYKKKSGRDLLTDLKSGKEADVAATLQGTWLGLAGKDPHAIIDRYNAKLNEETEEPAPPVGAEIDRHNRNLKNAIEAPAAANAPAERPSACRAGPFRIRPLAHGTPRRPSRK